MSADLVPRNPTAITVTAEQADLVTRTVAVGASPDELRLYLFDCARQGVHPLDRLLHFTKRKGRYTPITSIDFMRIRAAETGEYAGSDDAQFTTDGATLERATVTVWRLVSGTRCAFTASARWKEYKPDENDFMWRKMPHTMLGKCAEALALRKGFPRQLAGLYAAEEMDQAGPPAPTLPPEVADPKTPTTAAPGVAPLGGSNYATTQAPPAPEGEPETPCPPGAVRIRKVSSSPTKNPNVTKFFIVLDSGEEITTINAWLASLAEAACNDRRPVVVQTKRSSYGLELLAVLDPEQAAIPFDPPITAADIPF